MLALFIFAPLAAKLRRAIPEGYSYIELLHRGDRTFCKLQLALQLIMQIVIFGIQLVAGSEILVALTGSSYQWMVVGMAATPLCYTVFSGLRTSVFTDALQYLAIAMAAATLLICFPGTTITIDPHPFTPLNPDLLWEFGISSAIGLTVAIFADHQQWQRAFAIQERQIVPTFYKAALMHGFVTLSLGTLGCLGSANGFQPTHIDLVGFEYVQTHYTAIFTPIFVVMAMCALISTLDSALCAFAALAMKELCPTEQPSLREGRMWMMILAFAGALIALQRPSLVTLWFIGSTIRLAAFVPTISSIVTTGATTRAHSRAIVAGLIVGGSIFTIGVTSGNFHMRTVGMVLTAVSPAIVLGLGYLCDRRQSVCPETSLVVNSDLSEAL
jgi:Na+/proline symporter